MQQRLQRHLLAQLVTLGEHNITGLLCASGRQALDWSSDYRMYSRQRIAPEELFAQVRSALLEQLPPEEPVVVAVDDTRIRKSGKKVAGAKWTRDPLGPPFHTNFIWALRFCQLSMACAPPATARMVPIAWQHAPTPNRPRATAPEEEHAAYRQACRERSIGKVAVAQLQQTRTWLDEQGQQSRQLWCVGDGGFTNRTVLKDLPENTIYLGRIRSDAKLHCLPEPPAGRTGRRRVYGEVAPTPEQLRQDESIPWEKIPVWIAGQQHEVRVKTLAPLRWRAAGGGYDLKLVVIAPLLYRTSASGKHLYRKPAFLICTDPEADNVAILQRYINRWDIEVNFRDEKTLLGVGEAQVRDPNAVQNVTATAVAAYALLLAAAEQSRLRARDLTLPRPKWQRKEPKRATTQNLIQQMRFELWGQAMSFSHFVAKQSPTRSAENSLHHPYHAVMYSSRFS
jgi:pterin-4a-carbinolamine dehydratase